MSGFIYTNKSTPYSEVEDKDVDQVFKSSKKYLASVMRTFTKKGEEAAANENKYFYLDILNENDRFEDILKADILTDRYKHKIIKYKGPNKFKSSKYVLETLIKDNKYNKGIDPVTNQEYRVSIFTRKGDKSKFKNGILVSRDGIEYK